LPIYGSIHIARKCIKSVLERTEWPYNLTIVDDASDGFTVEWLKRQKFPKNVKVLFNNKNRGFAATVNRGIKFTTSPYVCLLNSDVLVTPRWLTKMVMALESSPRNVIVNPITNNTALINVSSQEGADYMSMNQAFEMTSQHKYPEIMPTGFCFLFRRELISRIGLFDEGFENFGEESDYWMKSITHLYNGYYMKYKAVLADDTYLFHERGASFSTLGDKKHMELRHQASGRFHKIWPQFRMWMSSNDPKKVMAPYRKKFGRKALFKKRAEYRICWAVRATSMCGGMKYIADIVNEINERGGDAKVALVKRDSKSPVVVIPELRSAPLIFDSEEEFIKTFAQRVFKKGVVVSAISELAHVVGDLCKENPELMGVNHVQSYDPMISQNEEQKLMAFQASTILPHTITNSEWISSTFRETHKVEPIATVHPGIDRTLFYPRGRDKGDDRATILLTLNKSYDFKGYKRGVMLAQYLNSIALQNKVELRIMAYGVDTVPEAPCIIGLGELTQPRLAHLLGTEVDIFIDPAHYHSYGLPNLEAMASGVPVFGWDNIGINEYGKDGKNCVIVPNDTEPKEAALKVFKLLVSVDSRVELAKEALITLKDHDRDLSVDKFIKELELNLGLSFPKRKVVFVSPHLRKHGGPTTIIHAANELSKKGHDVSLSCVYPDINPEVTLLSKVPISLDVNKIPPCDVLIVNSDNPDSKFFSSLEQAKHKILFKMSHNARFKELEEAGLVHPWDKVITTTQWLTDVCKNPTEGWNYSPVENAERVGWYHYSHPHFNCPPKSRKYGNSDTSFIITTLIHHHPMKGTKDVIQVLDRLRRKYSLECVGVGEVPPDNLVLPKWLNYQYSPNRDRMAEILRQTDIWVGASHTEGLGRMALEAMSCSVSCILSDTGAEFAEDGENCLLYPVGDLEKMEKTIEVILEDTDLFKKICTNANKTAAKYSNPTSFTKKLERIIHEICQ
jgi:glycosyltransferase involved in cell wall biosynthesis/GT2 family glycosyltransferase